MDQIAGVFWSLMILLVIFNAIHIVLTGKWTWFGLDRAANHLLQQLVNGLSRLITTIITTILTWLRDLLVFIFRGLWQHFLRPGLSWVFRTLGTGITWLWQQVVRPTMHWFWVQAVYPLLQCLWRNGLNYGAWLLRQLGQRLSWLWRQIKRAGQWLIQHLQLVLLAILLFLLFFLGP